MPKWKIISTEGVNMGTYEGETSEEALDAMARDAGYQDMTHANEHSAPFEGTVTRVDEPQNTWHVLSDETGTVLAVYGSALTAEAERRGREIATETGAKIALHTCIGNRPPVGGSISMLGTLTWL